MTNVMATEHDVQVALFEYAALRANQDPAWGLLFAIPNGGHRHKAVAGKMKAEGVKAGVPDIFLPVPRYSADDSEMYCGLFIELKRKGGRVSAKQQEWLKALNRQGYKAVVAHGFAAAKKEIEIYLGRETKAEVEGVGTRAIEVEKWNER